MTFRPERIAVLAILALAIALAVPTALTDPTSLAAIANGALYGTVGALLAVLFQPLRRSVQAHVGHRFIRSRYDADRTAAAFSDKLRDEVLLDGLETEIWATVRRTVQPATMSLRIR